jgi:hypothetical protein
LTMKREADASSGLRGRSEAATGLWILRTPAGSQARAMVSSNAASRRLTM